MVNGLGREEESRHAKGTIRDLRRRVIGGGLAGSEAAWQLAERGIAVTLHEMRPMRTTDAHRTDRFAELVCSNSLKSDQHPSASWLLKEELRRLDSLLLRAASRLGCRAGRRSQWIANVFAEEATRRDRVASRD